MLRKVSLFVLLTLLFSTSIFAQDLGKSVAVGFRGGVTTYRGDDFRNSKARAGGAIFLEWFLNDIVSIEGGVNGGEIGAERAPLQLKSQYLGFSPMLRFGIPSEKVRLYITGGGQGAIYRTNGITNFILSVPFGGGISFKVRENMHFDIRGIFNYVFKDNVDKQPIFGRNDHWAIGTAGFTWIFRSNKDKDDDGLLNVEEKRIGTNPEIADTDGDGLSDGQEVHEFRTDPLNADSDGDGLSDAAEINRFKTDPNKADSDEDGLMDGAEVYDYNTDPMLADTDYDGLNDSEEVTEYRTNPLKQDSDGDGLSDKEEIRAYMTNPLETDSDGDGLSDGDEVKKYKTNPNMKDSDRGSVDDGKEVARGTDPMNADDDVTLQIASGSPFVLEGVTFETNSARITGQSEGILLRVVNSLKANPGVKVEIRGYTDNVGRRDYNLKLSAARANSVRAYLVRNGIASNRLTAKGFGPDNPIAPNSTEDGRRKNRRIVFLSIR